MHDPTNITSIRFPHLLSPLHSALHPAVSSSYFLHPLPLLSPPTHKMSPPLRLFLLSLLFLTLPFTSLSTHGSSQNLQSISMDLVEKETLFRIMDSMSADRKWRVSNPNPCQPGSSWPGLECKLGQDSRLHVSRLDFGTPPNPTCRRTATFPTQVFQLPFLQSVFFFHCFTHIRTTISIPPSTNSLQQLSLRSNPALVGAIPVQISSLRSLEILTLSQNRLHGSIPSEISGLASLIHLDLSYNFLSGAIPNQLGRLTGLVGLDLSYNSLAGPIPESIGQMGALQKLDLSSNFLTGVIPDSLQNLRALVFLDLSNNRLKGYSPRCLPMLQTLQYLIMDGNPIYMPLPAELGKLGRLQEVRLANSGYFGGIPASFSQLVNLTTLSLENNRLTGEIPAGLSSLSRIYHLNLSRNDLGGVVPFDSGFVKRLGRNLDLSGNPRLCLDNSQVLVGAQKGIGLCQRNRNGSVLLPLKRSDAATLFCKFAHFFCLLCFWSFYQNSYL